MYNSTNSQINNEGKLNINNQLNKIIIKSNLILPKYIKLEKSYTNRDRYNASKENKIISKSTINNTDYKNKINSTFHLSKTNAKDSNLNKKLFKKLNPSLTCKNIESKTFFRSDSTICGIPKHSPFFKYSQNDNVSAHKIYKHYIDKSMGQITDPIRNYKRLFDDRSQTFLQKLSKIYCENQNFLAILKEIKDNNKIAYKKDFDIEEYQSIIMELLDPRISENNLVDMRNEFRDLNKKIYGVLEPRGRFTNLAEKLRYNLPLFLLEKLKQLDKEAILNRMKYYNKFKQFKNDKLVWRFGSNSKKKDKRSMNKKNKK